MSPLALNPIPSQRADSPADSRPVAADGFVDDDVVHALLTGPVSPRNGAIPSDLVLAADMDFAGWCLSGARSPVPESRSIPQTPAPEEETPRRPAPPAIDDESGIGSPYDGKHRWWLAGLAGALSTMLFSLLLLTLASRTPGVDRSQSISRSPVEAPPAQAAEPAPEVPSFTDANPPL